MFVLDTKSLIESHHQFLQHYDRITYHHIPIVGKTVVDAYSRFSTMASAAERTSAFERPNVERSAELLKLFFELSKPDMQFEDFEEEHSKKNFLELRDAIMTLGNPMDLDFMAKVNTAEAAYMEASSGSTAGVGYKTILMDCGGGHLINEYCLKIKGDAKDLDFVLDILDLIKENSNVVFSPIEQRFCAASSALMAPNYSGDLDDRYKENTVTCKYNALTNI